MGEHKARIGEDESRVLEFVPARFELRIHVRPKYACSHCCDGVVAPEAPPRSFERVYCGAWLTGPVGLVSKFSDHIPAYTGSRVSSARHGLYLPRSTLCDWVGKVADLLKPL